MPVRSDGRKRSIFTVGITLRGLIMDNDILKAIEKKAGRITKNVLKEIHTRPEARYYIRFPEEVISDRISRVVRDVCRRIEIWLGKNEPKNLFLAPYSELGAARCKECIPLEDTASVILMIRREISDVISARTNSGDTDSPDQPGEKISHYVNLLFAGIIQSTIAGYRNELAATTRKRRYE